MDASSVFGIIVPIVFSLVGIALIWLIIELVIQRVQLGPRQRTALIALVDLIHDPVHVGTVDPDLVVIGRVDQLVAEK